MKKFGGKFALILGLTLLGLDLPSGRPRRSSRPGSTSRAGRSWSTRSTRPATAAGNVNLDELITALKRRINPEGVLDIPIRKIGNNRIEVILPKATAEEVEEVKRKMTNVGSLEFRILANHKHDAGRDRPGPGAEGPDQPPVEIQLGQARRDDHRHEPDRPTRKGPRSPTPRSAGSRTPSPGRTVYLTGKNSAGLEQADVGDPDRGEHGQHAQAPEAAQAGDGHLLPDRVQPQPDHRRQPDQPVPDRPDHPRGEGRPRPHRALRPLQGRPAGRHRQAPGQGRGPAGRPLPAGRRLRLQPHRGAGSSAT